MLKAGILGGGQLGRMLLQAAANYPVETYVMENDPGCPAAHLCHHFVLGDIRSFDDVYNFGKGLDAVTIEIESVNEEALEKLESEGVAVYPKPSALKIIKNKIRQKAFYAQQNVPTSAFVITKNLRDLEQHTSFLPAVHKIAEGGYDGRGVQVIRSAEETGEGFDAPAVLEKMVDIEKEIAQIIAVNTKGEIALYPPVDMVFDPKLNLLDYQISPADIPENIQWRIEAIALAVVKGLKSPGIFAVELFIDKKGEVYVNETAPRVHNSGHHTIEANYSSQFDMLWRVILGYPLGNPSEILPAAIVNLLGEKGYSGEAQYQGLNDVLQMENVFVHLYGKKQTKPGRKMGHVTIMHTNRQDLIYTANRIKQYLKVISLMATLFFVSCKEKKEVADAGTPKSMNLPLQAEGFIVQQRALNENIEVPGTLLPFETTQIRPEISGRIVDLHIPEGQVVQKGALLVKLFDGDLQAQLRKLEVQLSISEKTSERQGELLKIGGISQQEADLGELDVNNLKADIQLVKVNITKTRIVAPYSGKIGLKNISLGAYVTPADILTTISQVNELKLEFTVPEKYSELMKKGRRVGFLIDGSDKNYQAQIMATESLIEANTRSLRVRAIVKGTDPTLVAGGFAKVSLELGQNENPLVVPTQAVIPKARDKRVIVYRGGSPEFKVIKTGVRDSTYIQVLDGLNAGDTVITTALLAIRPESKIRLTKINQ